MTVGDLRAALAGYPPEMPVLLFGQAYPFPRDIGTLERLEVPAELPPVHEVRTVGRYAGQTVLLVQAQPAVRGERSAREVLPTGATPFARGERR